MILEHANPFVYTMSSYAKRLLFLMRSFRCMIVRIKEDTCNGEPALVLYYCGETQTLEYIKNLCFQNPHQEILARIPWWRLKKELNRLKLFNATVIIETNRLLDFCVPQCGFQTFPWIRQIVSVNDAMTGAREKKIEDVYGRKVRQYGYRFAISIGRNDVSEFYYGLYVPYVSFRYGTVAYLRKLKEFQFAVKKGFLLQVFENDQWIAGSLCTVRGNTVSIVAGGLAPEFNYHLKRGAMSACDYFLFKWAQKHSMETIDFMRSRANTHDGLFEYKRKWGAIPANDVWPHTSLWIYVPNGTDIPMALNKQLMWDKIKFGELETVAGLTIRR